jgi:hypothetical protein
MARFLASDEAATCTQPIRPTEITRYRASEMAVFSLDMRYCHVAIVLLALNGPAARHNAHRDLDG